MIQRIFSGKIFKLYFIILLFILYFISNLHSSYAENDVLSQSSDLLDKIDQTSQYSDKELQKVINNLDTISGDNPEILDIVNKLKKVKNLKRPEIRSEIIRRSSAQLLMILRLKKFIPVSYAIRTQQYQVLKDNLKGVSKKNNFLGELIRDLLAKIFKSIKKDNSEAVSGTFKFVFLIIKIILWLAGICVLVLLGYLIFKMISSYIDSIKHADKISVDPLNMNNEDISLRKAFFEAHKGNYKEALIFIMNAMILLLSKKGVIKTEKSRTNREYADDIKKKNKDAFFENFNKAVNIHERTLYAGKNAEKKDYEEVLSIYNRVNSQNGY